MPLGFRFQVLAQGIPQGISRQNRPGFKEFYFYFQKHTQLYRDIYSDICYGKNMASIIEDVMEGYSIENVFIKAVSDTVFFYISCLAITSNDGLIC